MLKRVDGRLGHRGQQLGEYAVMLGTVAMAVIAMQMTISRRVVGKLSLYSRVMLGGITPIEETQKPTVSKSTVKEVGGAIGVQTTLTSDSSGSSSAGFILAEAYGPEIGEALQVDPSELQALLALDLVKPTDEVVELTKNEKGRVEATVLRNGEQVTVGFTVLTVTKDERGALWADIDTDGDGVANVTFAGILKSVVDKGALIESVLTPRLEFAKALLDDRQQVVDIAEKRGVSVDDVLKEELKEAFDEDSQTIKKGWEAATLVVSINKKKLEEAEGKSLWDLPIKELEKLKTETDKEIGPLKLASRAIDRRIERGRHEPRLSGDVNEQDLLSSKIGFSQPPAAGPAAPDGQGKVTEEEEVTFDDVLRLTGNNAKSKNPIRMDGELLDTVVTGGVDDTLPDLIRTGKGTYEQVVWVPVKAGKADQRTEPGEDGPVLELVVLPMADMLGDDEYMKAVAQHSAKERQKIEDAAFKVINRELPDKDKKDKKEQQKIEDAANEVINRELPDKDKKDKKVREAALSIIVSYRQLPSAPTFKEFVADFEKVQGYVNGSGYEAYFSDKKDIDQLKKVLERVANPKSKEDHELAQAMEDLGYLGESDEVSVRGGKPMRVSDNKLLTEVVYMWNGKPLLVEDSYESFRQSFRLADGVNGTLVYHDTYKNLPIGIDEDNDGAMDLTFGAVPGNPDLTPQVVGRTVCGVTQGWQSLTRDSTYEEEVYGDPMNPDTGREPMTPLAAVMPGHGDSKRWIVRSNMEVKDKEGKSRTPYLLVRDSNNNNFLDQEDTASEIQPPETRVARDRPGSAAGQPTVVDTGALPAAIVKTQHDDRVTYSEMRAAGEHPDTFGRTDVWIRHNPKAVDPDERPFFGPRFGEEKDPRFKDEKATGPPRQGPRSTLPATWRQTPLPITPYVAPKPPVKWEQQ